MGYELKEAKVRLEMRENPGIYSDRKVSSPDDVIEILQKEFGAMDREYVVTVNLDNQMRPLNYHIVNIGSVSASIIDIPGVFKTAILSNASSIILAHNHPSSGDASKEDYEATKRVAQAGDIIGIPLLDHVVFCADGRKHSIRAKNPDMFNTVYGGIIK